MPAQDQHPPYYDQEEDITQEEYSFDELAKGLADGSLSRRRALKLIGGALLGGSLLAILPASALATEQSIGGGGGGRRRRHHHHHHRRRRGSGGGGAPGCPSGTVTLSNGTCATPCGGSIVCVAGCGGCDYEAVTGTGYCRDAGGALGPCQITDDCPTGQFCVAGAPESRQSVCTGAC